MQTSKTAIREQVVKTVVRSGNGGAVWVPKSWLGEEVVVMLPEKPRLDLREKAMRLLGPHLKDVVSAGIYGSYARNEQTRDSDIDILVITRDKDIKLGFRGGKIEIVSFPIDKLKAAIEKYPAVYYQMVQEAVPLINAPVLEELKNIMPNKENFKGYLKDTEEHLKSSKELLELDKLDGIQLKSYSVLYSSLLRLRGLFIIKCILNIDGFSIRKLKKWLLSLGLSRQEFEDSYNVYRLIRDNRSSKRARIRILTAEKLLGMLDKELRELEARINDKQKEEAPKGD